MTSALEKNVAREAWGISRSWGECVSFRQVRKGFTEIMLEIPEESERPSHVVSWKLSLPGRGNNKCKDLRSRLLRVIQEDQVSQWGWVQMSQVCL